MTTPQNKKRFYIAVVIVIVIVAAGLFAVLTIGQHTPAPTETDESGVQGATDGKDDPTARVAGESPKEKLKRFRAMREKLAERAKSAGRENPPEMARPPHAPPASQTLRTSTRQERRTQRESIVLDSIHGMVKNGDTEKALVMLNQQRSLFPEEDETERAAFEIIIGCIKEGNEAAPASADRFTQKHPQFRMNRYINRICGR